MMTARTRLTIEEIRVWAKAVVAQAFDKIPMPAHIKRPPDKWRLND